MSYADLTYYKGTYKGFDPQDDDEIEKMLERATDDINMRCSCTPLVESDYHPNQWEYIKKANCAQAEYYLLNGEGYNEGGSPSATLGRFSYSGGEKGSSSFSSRFSNYLASSGICGP